MPGFVLSGDAETDILDIGRYTEKHWGATQRRKYLEALDDRFSVLAESPGLGRPRDEFGAGYRSLREGRHLIFYKRTPTGIIVIRVLHESMDPGRHIGG